MDKGKFSKEDIKSLKDLFKRFKYHGQLIGDIKIDEDDNRLKFELDYIIDTNVFSLIKKLNARVTQISSTNVTTLRVIIRKNT